MIDIAKQQQFLIELATLDAKLNATKNILINIEKEQQKLIESRKDLIFQCCHVDEEGSPAIGGGNMFAFCVICGQLLEESEIDNLESELDELEKEKED